MLLLGLFAALAISSSVQSSPTPDEVYHLASGYSYIDTGEFRFALDHPPLIKMLAGAPLLALDLNPVASTPGWIEGDRGLFENQFAWHNRAPLRRMLFVARLPVAALGVALGGFLFLWARELWGYWPAVFVLFLYALSPNVLAHAGLVTTDLGVTCFTLLTIFALWKFFRSGSLAHAAWCGLALAGALLSKYSAVVTAFLVLALLVARCFALWGRQDQGRPDDPCASRGRRRPGSPFRESVRAAAVIALIVVASIELGFGFPAGLSDYYAGASELLREFAGEARIKPSFLWGEYSATGFWHYYLLAQLWKTPIPTLVFFAASVLLIARDRSAWLDGLFVLLPLAAFHVLGVMSEVNIGVRHVLPVFPFVFLACGATARWVGGRGLPAKAVFAALCMWYAIGTVRAYPHFIPYFNGLVGGPDKGIFYLDDSNIDWGQDVYRLQEYVRERRPAAVRLAIFGMIPGQDYGITSEPLGLRDLVWPREDVTYLVSAELLQRQTFYEQNPAVRFHWLDRYRPVDKVGWSIFVYRFSTDPADRYDPGVFYIPEEQWIGDAVTTLQAIVARSPHFTEAVALLREARAAARQTESPRPRAQPWGKSG